jgi:hypothetical protein
MPIRRLNFTKRLKLTRERVAVRLSPKAAGQPRTFDVTFNLPEGLPGNARVFVEAYRSSPAARMRFDFGTVAVRTPPAMDARRLAEFGDDLPPLFRVKVTDAQDQPGRLLADATGIKAADPDEKPDRRKGILHIHHRDLEGLVWELDFDNPGYEPTLWIDKAADPARELGHDAKFAALVYPEVLRATLVKILVDDPDLAEDAAGWGRRWFEFARALPGMAGDEVRPDDDPEDKRAWIGRAVRQFARQRDFGLAFRPAPGDD